MIDSAVKRVVVIGGSNSEFVWVSGTLSEGDESVWLAERAEDAAATMALFGRSGFELIVYFLNRPDDESALVMLRRIREFAFSIPIVCLANIETPDDASPIIRAGAHECSSRSSPDASDFRRAVRFALARGAFLKSLEERRESAARDREMGGLNAMGNITPLPITGRSFGMLSLIDRAPHKFSEFVAEYSGLLDLALEERTVRVESRLSEELHTLADRLGIFGAGPRDIIDLHKASITCRLEGQPLRRARAYVEEGRLVLLQIMGFLASFYRHLSWGAGSDPRGHITREQLLAASPTSTGKGST